MRFMILVRATPLSEGGAMPTEEMLAEQLAFHEELSRAGVLRDAAGFKPTSSAWRVGNLRDERTAVLGPFDVGHRLSTVEWQG